ncbi:MAG: hypothetical protein DPW09_42985 [Anaerolineae bacterium]|nr:hypothetical protein [Anaerolineae bacterium]
MARRRRSLQQEIEFILLVVEPRAGASVAAAYPLLSVAVKRDWLLVAAILAVIWLSVFRFWGDTLRYWFCQWGPAQFEVLWQSVWQQFGSREVYGYG